MALKTLAGIVLRQQLRQNVFNPNSVNTWLNRKAQQVLPQIRFDSTDTKAEVVVDCSGNACEPIKRGIYCAPGTEEYCIAGHMPGQDDIEVGEHSTVTPGQYSRINTESKDGKPEAESKEK